MSDRNGNSNNNEWFIRVLLTIAALAIGFGISQITLAGDVRENSTEIRSMKDQNKELIGLMRDLVSQNGEWLALERNRNK